MGGKYTDAQKRASVKYLTDKTDNLQVRIPKGYKERYKEHAKQRGKSLTSLIIELLERDIKELTENEKPTSE